MYQFMYQRHKYNNMPHLIIIMFFLFGVAGATPDIGDRCAVGHCENPNDCPRCRAGLMCDTTADQMCAGTCYGVCASTTPSPGSHRSGNRSVTGCARAGDTCTDITGPGTCTLDGATSTSLSCIVQVVYDSFFSTNQTYGHSSSSPSSTPTTSATGGTTAVPVGLIR